MAERYEGINRSRREIFVNNFIGGIAWGLGATVGLAILLLVLGMISSRVDLVPYVGEFVSDVSKEVLQKNPQLVE